MDDTEAGQTRLLTYAIDLAVDADAQAGQPERCRDRGPHLGGDAARPPDLSAGRESTPSRTTATQARTVVVEPLIQPEWELLEPAAPTERTATHYRFDLALPGKAGAP